MTHTSFFKEDLPSGRVVAHLKKKHFILIEGSITGLHLTKQSFLGNTDHSNHC